MATKTLLSAVSTTGTGDAVNAADLADGETTRPSSFTVQVTTSNTTTAATVDLEGSIDGTNYETLASHALTAAEITAKSAMFHVVNKPVTGIRGNLSAFTQNSAETVTVTVMAGV